jgi:hypothetical protein
MLKKLLFVLIITCIFSNNLMAGCDPFIGGDCATESTQQGILEKQTGIFKYTSSASGFLYQILNYLEKPIGSTLATMNVNLVNIDENINNIYNLLVTPPITTRGDKIIQDRYIAYKQISDQSEKDTSDFGKQVANMLQYGSSNLSEESQLSKSGDQDINNITAVTEVGSMTGTQLQNAIENMTSGNIFTTTNQETDAFNFVKLASGAYIGIPAKVTTDKNKNDSKHRKYVAYQKTLAAIQTATAKDLLKTYAERKPYQVAIGDNSSVITSKKSLLNDINLSDPSNPEYWKGEGTGNQGILPRLLSFFSTFFSINFALNHIADKLDNISKQLDYMTTLSVIGIQQAVLEPMKYQ